MKLNKKSLLRVGLPLSILPLLSGCFLGDKIITKTVKEGIFFQEYYDIAVVDEKIISNEDDLVDSIVTLKNVGHDLIIPSYTNIKNYIISKDDGSYCGVNYYYEDEVIKGNIVFPGDMFKVKITNFTTGMTGDYLDYIVTQAIPGNYSSLKTINNPTYPHTTTSTETNSYYFYKVEIPVEDRIGYTEAAGNLSKINYTTVWTYTFNGESKTKVSNGENLTLISGTTTFDADVIEIQKVEYLNYSGYEYIPATSPANSNKNKGNAVLFFSIIGGIFIGIPLLLALAFLVGWIVFIVKATKKKKTTK